MVDDGDAPAAGAILGREGASTLHRYGERRKVRGRDVVTQHRRCVLGPRLRSADDVQRAVRASRAHRCTPIYRRRDDARDALDLGEHPIDERWRAPWRVLDFRWPDPEADQA